MGRVARPRSWTVDELRGMPAAERVIDIHCVTRWSMTGTAWRGVPLTSLLAMAEPAPDARFISFVAHSPRRHSTSLLLDDAYRLAPLVAWEWQGAPIPGPHGGPLRVIVPDRYFYKSVKWLIEIELLAEDRLGYWEGAAGYHNEADPWREQRFVAPDITRTEAARILAERDLSGRTARTRRLPPRSGRSAGRRRRLARRRFFPRHPHAHRLHERESLGVAFPAGRLARRQIPGGGRRRGRLSRRRPARRRLSRRFPVGSRVL